MKIIIFLSFWLLLVQVCLSQGVFQRTIGGTGDDRIWSILQTNDGGYAAAGATTVSADGLNFYVIKLGSDGMLQWTRTIGGNRNEEAQSLLQTPGGYLVSGYSGSFGTLLENAMLLVKLSSAGLVQWTKTVDGPGDDLAISSILTSDGGYALVGHTNSSGAGGYDCCIVKLDSGGTYQWGKTIGSSGTDFGYSIYQTTGGGYIITGYSNSFGAGSLDMHIVKLNAEGNFVWGRTIGGTETDAGYSIIQTSDGGYVAAGYTISFGAGYVDMYFVKLDSSGVLQWTKTLGGTNSDVVFSIFPTPDGGFTAAAYTDSFGAGLRDMCILKFTAGGILQWSKTVGGTFYDDAWTISTTSDNGYIMGGRSSSFGQVGNYDAYVVKLGDSGNTCTNHNNAALLTGSGGIFNTVNPLVLPLTFSVITQTPVISSGGTLSVVCNTMSIEPVSNETPVTYKLWQNYPNPFNPVTKIKFDVPVGTRHGAFLRIVVYDISGRLVAVLLDENKAPGKYEVDWDGTGFASGVYFYKLTAHEVSGSSTGEGSASLTTGFVETKKMILLK